MTVKEQIAAMRRDHVAISQVNIFKIHFDDGTSDLVYRGSPDDMDEQTAGLEIESCTVWGDGSVEMLAQ